jgi:hypothetical protein
MLRYFYRWRYQRAQKASAFKIPKNLGNEARRHDYLRSYLGQSSVRGRDFSRFDLPRKRRRRLGWLIGLIASLLLLWIVLESIAALALFRE